MKYIKFKIKNRISYISINRPDKLNSLSNAVIDELIKVVEDIQCNKKIDVAIITGIGNKSFIAGADIGEMSKMDRAQSAIYSQKGQTLTHKIETSRVPFIAAINGFALGGGCEIALACHIRYAYNTAKFGQPEVKLGLIAGFGGTQRLPRLVGRGQAMEILLSGKVICAEEALRIGLINKLVEYNDPNCSALIDECNNLADLISNNSRTAVASTIKAIIEGENRSIEDALVIEKEIFSNIFNTYDSREGMLAFLEKRKANFKK